MNPPDRASASLSASRPFPGLRPYSFADHAYFFGREEQAFALYRLLDRSQFTAVVGSSGSGKSSLVRAGLLPLLQDETNEGRARTWQWRTLRPGNQPLARLAAELAGSAPETDDESEHALHSIRHETIEVLLRHSSFGLREAVHEIQELKDHSVLIVVDQFEEIFRYADRSDGEHDDALMRESRVSEAAAFVQLLLEASRDPSRRIHVMLTMRSDYLGECAIFHELPEAVAANQFLVPSLTRDQREAAIRGPIEQAEGTIESGLVQRLLNEGHAANDQLPVLQHALMRTWDAAGRRNPAAVGTPSEGGAGLRHLTGADYETIGTLNNALSQHAEEIMSQLPGLELAVEQTFRALAELDRDNRAIRRPRSFDRLCAETGVATADLHRVLDRFRREDCSFIVPAPAEPISGDTVIDIGHEALIRRWDRMSANPSTGDGRRKGWLWSEAEDGNTYRGLLALAGGDTASGTTTLPTDQVERRWRWWTSRPRTGAWAARYGGGLEQVQGLFENSRRALEDERAERAKQERHRRVLTRVAVIAAVVASILAVGAGYGFWQADTAATKARIAEGQARKAEGQARKAETRAREAADQAREAAIETTAGAFWYRLQLWGEDLQPEDVATLWDLSQQDDEVHVAFVRQLANDPALLRRFGFKPDPIARAIGLRWPDEAREVIKDSLKYVASDQFNPKNPFELMAYTRALAALKPWLDAETAEGATANIVRKIEQLTSDKAPGDPQIWVLAETVQVLGSRPDAPKAIEPARDRLAEIIRIAATDPSADWRGRTISRAIIAMAPYLEEEDRLRAIGYLVPLLGQPQDTFGAQAVPRALTALLAQGEPGKLPEILGEVAQEIARVAVAKASDSSYLLALMQVAETLGAMDDPAGVAAFGEALTARLAQPNDPFQRAALARAAIPVLARNQGVSSRLVLSVANAILVPEGSHLDPRARSLFRKLAAAAAEPALRQALSAPDGAANGERAEAALNLLRADWPTGALPPDPAKGSSPPRTNPYRLAAQVRLLGMLAPSLGDTLSAQASTDLLALLPQTRDALTREAIARALRALAPALPEAERKASLAAAKGALATTGNTEEAMAWAGTLAALTPDDAGAATVELIEALKYPTVTGEPTDMLLRALAAKWPDGDTILGTTFPDPVLMKWLEQHAPGEALQAAPIRPTKLPGPDAAVARL